MDGIIFDVDGTLWDSVEVVAESWNLAIKENSDLEPNLNREILQGLFGKTMDEIAAGVFPDLDTDSRRKLMDICFDYENRYLETHPGVYYEGVMDTLKELALEYPLFIVSNCQCGYIEVMMKGAGMEPYINDFLCFGQTQTSKDLTILKLMEKNNLTSPVYVGDTQGDADSCKKAGIPFIFAAYGLGDVKEDYPTIHSFSELKNILRELD
jgi:phosphoglycolate phosphatase